MRTLTWLVLVSLVCLTTSCSGTAPDGVPGSSGGPPATTDADNTARNADTSILAEPTSQSESEADIRISAAIRKAVVDDNSLSLNAHNIKIITADGAVTLRGPVKSEQEKASIESKAKQVAGVTKVNNLLEVEKNP